jgi:hypothetical protein
MRFAGKSCQVEVIEIDLVVFERSFLQARPERFERGHATRLRGGLAFKEQDAPRSLVGRHTISA